MTSWSLSRKSSNWSLIKTINLNWTGLYTNPNFLNGIYSLDSNLTVNLDTVIVTNSWKLRKSWIKTSGYDVSDIFARQFGPRSGQTSGPNNSFWSIFRFWPGFIISRWWWKVSTLEIWPWKSVITIFHHGEWKISLLKKQNQKKTSSVWEAFSLFASVVIFMKSYNIFMTRHWNTSVLQFLFDISSW